MHLSIIEEHPKKHTFTNMIILAKISHSQMLLFHHTDVLALSQSEDVVASSNVPFMPCFATACRAQSGNSSRLNNALPHVLIASCRIKICRMELKIPTFSWKTKHNKDISNDWLIENNQQNSHTKTIKFKKSIFSSRKDMLPIWDIKLGWSSTQQCLKCVYGAEGWVR